jgi:hypothetical protein
MRAAGHIMAKPGPYTAYSPTGEYGGVLEATSGDWWAVQNPLSSFYQGVHEYTVVTLAAGFSFVQGAAAGVGAAYAGAYIGSLVAKIAGPLAGGVASLASSYMLLDYAGQVHDHLYYNQWGINDEYSWLYDWSFASGAILGALYGKYLNAPETVYEVVQEAAPFVDVALGQEQGTTMTYVDQVIEGADIAWGYVTAPGEAYITYLDWWYTAAQYGGNMTSWPSAGGGVTGF